MSLTGEFLNSPAEAHAVWFGFTRSLYSPHPLRRPKDPEHADSKKEEQYFRLGWLAGDIVQLAIIAVVWKWSILMLPAGR